MYVGSYLRTTIYRHVSKLIITVSVPTWPCLHSKQIMYKFAYLDYENSTYNKITW